MKKKISKDSAIVGASDAGIQKITSDGGLITGINQRRIYQILNANRAMVGTLPILRAFAGDRQDYVSPYVLFDEFGPVEMHPGDKPLRVDAHPHAGVIPTTYFIEGSGHHKDSLNYDFQIGKGEFMMFSSGKGAIHMEETGQKMYDEGGHYHGFQIWLNMPARYKFIDPTTSVHDESSMGIIRAKNYSIKVILGKLFDVASTIELLSPAFYYHIQIDKDARLDIPTDPTHNAFIYMIKGETELTQQQYATGNQIVLFKRGESMISMYAKERSELLLLGGQPLDEVVYSYGPFVMNNEEQIRQCIINYQLGRMGDPDQVN